MIIDWKNFQLSHNIVTCIEIWFYFCDLAQTLFDIDWKTPADLLKMNHEFEIDTKWFYFNISRRFIFDKGIDVWLEVLFCAESWYQVWDSCI